MAATEFPVVAETQSSGVADATRPLPRGLTLVTNALSVMAAKTAAMAFGFVFWIIAAHEFSRVQVGLAAGVVSAMMLCTQLAIGGVGSAVITCYAEYRERPSRLLDTSGSVVVFSALAAAGIFLVAASVGLRHLDAVPANPWYALAFTLMTVFGTVGILLDQLSIALGRGDQVLVRGLVFGGSCVAGIGLLPLVLTRAHSLAIFMPWVLAGGANVALGLLQLRRMLPDYRFRGQIDRTTASDLMRHGLPNYALTLMERAPGLLLPIVVTEILSPEANATWYAVWMMAWVVYTIPVSAGLSLFAEGANNPASLQQAAGKAIRVALLVGLASSLILGAGAHLFLSLLGRTYGVTGAEPLRILLLAFVPLTFVQAYFATSRARRRLGEAVLVSAVSAVASVGAAAAAGAIWGLTGMAFAWLGVQGATSIWAISRQRPLTPLRLGRAAMAFIRVRTWLGVLDHQLAAVAIAALALALWISSLGAIDLDRMNGFGLVSVLPLRFYAALVLLTFAFAWTLRSRPDNQPLLLGLVLLLVVMLFALPALIEDVPRFAVTWRHVGISQAILATGHVDPRVDAYFNWPGFFILTGLLAKLAGFSTVLPLAAWSPVYFNLVYLLPLLVIVRTLTDNRRSQWLTIWLFYVGNWIGQDYFSPQGFSFFLYLVILAILLRWFVSWPGDEPVATGPRLGRFVKRRSVTDWSPPRSARAHYALLASLVFLFVALVPTHQLTPVAVFLTTTALVITRACRLRWLPVVMAATIAAWWGTGARTFFKGHLHTVLSNAGKLNAAVSQNVTNRVAGDADHRMVVNLTLAAGAAMWLLAALGAWQLLRANRRYWPAVVVTLAPIPLVVLQTYGGEMLLRVQLFALPFTAFFAASFLVGLRQRPMPGFGWQARVVAVCVVLLGFFFVSRYGNEKLNRFTTAEETALRHLYAVAQPGSTLVAGTGNLPWKYRDYEDHRYRYVVKMQHWGLAARPSASLAPLLADVRGTMRTSKPGGYLIIERSEKDEVDQRGLGIPGSLERFEAAVARSPSFRTIYQNGDATIFALRTLRPAKRSTGELATTRGAHPILVEKTVAAALPSSHRSRAGTGHKSKPTKRTRALGRHRAHAAKRVKRAPVGRQRRP